MSNPKMSSILEGLHSVNEGPYKGASKKSTQDSKPETSSGSKYVALRDVEDTWFLTNYYGVYFEKKDKKGNLIILKKDWDMMCQKGEKRGHADRLKAIIAENADLIDEDSWITIHGAHVQIDDKGQIKDEKLRKQISGKSSSKPIPKTGPGSKPPSSKYASDGEDDDVGSTRMKKTGPGTGRNPHGHPSDDDEEPRPSRRMKNR